MASYLQCRSLYKMIALLYSIVPTILSALPLEMGVYGNIVLQPILFLSKKICGKLSTKTYSIIGNNDVRAAKRKSFLLYQKV